MQAVLRSSGIVWVARTPEREFPRSAVCPLPIALLFNVIASKPKFCSVQPLFQILLGGIGGDRGQVSPLLLAEVLRISPVLLVGAPEVAVVAVPLPAFFAGFDALVPAAVGS